MAKKSDAYSSGMRGSEKKKEGKINGVRIEKAENGHVVHESRDFTEHSPTLESPKGKLFEDGNEDAMVEHVMKSLGIKHNKADDENEEMGDCNGSCPSCCK